MDIFESFEFLDSHPFTGERILNKPIRVKLKDNEYVRHFFDGSEDYKQITNLTMGKEYLIYKVEGFGDVADAFITDDYGNEKEIMIDMLEEVKEEI